MLSKIDCDYPTGQAAPGAGVQCVPRYAIAPRRRARRRRCQHGRHFCSDIVGTSPDSDLDVRLALLGVCNYATSTMLCRFARVHHLGGVLYRSHFDGVRSGVAWFLRKVIWAIYRSDSPFLPADGELESVSAFDMSKYIYKDRNYACAQVVRGATGDLEQDDIMIARYSGPSSLSY